MVQRFFGVLIFAPIQTSLSLEIQSTPPPPPSWGKCTELLFCLLTLLFVCLFFNVLIAVALSDFKVPNVNSKGSCTNLMILLFESGV